jgi:predicted permease
MRNGSTATSISIPGYTPSSPGSEGPLDSADVAPRFFETAGLPLISGRDIAATDTADAPKVVVINESLARRYFPGKDPVGLWIGTGAGDAKFQIIGVARDARIMTLRREARPAMFFAALQGRTDRIGSIEIRTAGDPASVMAAARRTVLGINNRLLLSVKTMDQQVDDTLTQERMIGKLSGFFGVLALLLASIGLYGLMAYSVARRTREIGIRMAVGAERRHVQWMVLRETLVVVAAGIAIGVPATVAGARLARYWIEGLLYNTAATDPVTIATAAWLLLGVAVMAGCIPARRASRLDPMTALRYDG